VRCPASYDLCMNKDITVRDFNFILGGGELQFRRWLSYFLNEQWQELSVCVCVCVCVRERERERERESTAYSLEQRKRSI
jgi:hypothetical protein